MLTFLSARRGSGPSLDARQKLTTDCRQNTVKFTLVFSSVLDQVLMLDKNSLQTVDNTQSSLLWFSPQFWTNSGPSLDARQKLTTDCRQHTVRFTLVFSTGLDQVLMLVKNSLQTVDNTQSSLLWFSPQFWTNSGPSLDARQKLSTDCRQHTVKFTLVFSTVLDQVLMLVKNSRQTVDNIKSGPSLDARQKLSTDCRQHTVKFTLVFSSVLDQVLMLVKNSRQTVDNTQSGLLWFSPQFWTNSGPSLDARQKLTTDCRQHTVRFTLVFSTVLDQVLMLVKNSRQTVDNIQSSLLWFSPQFWTKSGLSLDARQKLSTDCRQHTVKFTLVFSSVLDQVLMLVKNSRQTVDNTQSGLLWFLLSSGPSLDARQKLTTDCRQHTVRFTLVFSTVLDQVLMLVKNSLQTVDNTQSSFTLVFSSVLDQVLMLDKKLTTDCRQHTVKFTLVFSTVLDQVLMLVKNSRQTVDNTQSSLLWFSPQFWTNSGPSLDARQKLTTDCRQHTVKFTLVFSTGLDQVLMLVKNSRQTVDNIQSSLLWFSPQFWTNSGPSLDARQKLSTDCRQHTVRFTLVFSTVLDQVLMLVKNSRQTVDNTQSSLLWFSPQFWTNSGPSLDARQKLTTDCRQHTVKFTLVFSTVLDQVLMLVKNSRQTVDNTQSSLLWFSPQFWTKS
ncbi:hypothetical protein RRG08_045680 [Elysia crispata]|uniref:Uncharacterized protein n=1 Tax=Elysia crispata TaxID=231223 RepID=A0AAE0Z5Y0_9GAST|nr:hypothetical protein RRG08_045680 [Elysia crispata]